MQRAMLVSTAGIYRGPLYMSDFNFVCIWMFKNRGSCICQMNLNLTDFLKFKCLWQNYRRWIYRTTDSKISGVLRLKRRFLCIKTFLSCLDKKQESWYRKITDISTNVNGREEVSRQEMRFLYISRIWIFENIVNFIASGEVEGYVSDEFEFYRLFENSNAEHEQTTAKLFQSRRMYFEKNREILDRYFDFSEYTHIEMTRKESQKIPLMIAIRIETQEKFKSKNWGSCTCQMYLNFSRFENSNASDRISDVEETDKSNVIWKL